MLSKEEIEKAKSWLSALDIKSEYEATSKEIILQHIEQLETEIKEVTTQRNKLATELSDEEDNKQKLIEKLEEKIKSVEKCYQDLIGPYYDEKLNLINTSLMSKGEKEEFVNKRNCLLVQKHCYDEILSILKGTK